MYSTRPTSDYTSPTMTDVFQVGSITKWPSSTSKSESGRWIVSWLPFDKVDHLGALRDYLDVLGVETIADLETISAPPSIPTLHPIPHLDLRSTPCPPPVALPLLPSSALWATDGSP